MLIAQRHVIHKAITAKDLILHWARHPLDVVAARHNRNNKSKLTDNVEWDPQNPSLGQDYSFFLIIAWWKFTALPGSAKHSNPACMAHQ